jgi:hypothetical protein
MAGIASGAALPEAEPLQQPKRRLVRGIYLRIDCPDLGM